MGMILLVLTWGTAARAYVGAAMTFAVIISYSTTLATGLYPKLLAKPDSETVETALKLMMLFAIPMFGGILLLSGQLLTILRADYSAAAIVLYVYAGAYLLDSLSTTLDTITTATEHADMSNETSFRELVKSRLFFLPTLTYVSGTLYLSILLVFLKLFATEPIQAGMYTGLAYIIATVPVFIIRYRTAKKSLLFSFPIRSLARYVLATVLMVVFLSQINLASTLTRVMIRVIIGSVIYFGTVLLVDSETRVLARNITDFISEKLKSGNVDPKK